MRVDTIINGDNVEVLRTFPDDCIDLTVTSPPYDNLRTYKGFTWDFENLAKELFRVTKQGGVVVWVVGDATIKGSETGTSFKQALYFKEIGFRLHDTMIYEKSSCVYPEVNRYYPIFEYMFIISKGKPNTASLIKDRANIYSGDKIARKTGNKKYNGDRVPNSAYKKDINRRINDYGIRYNIWRYSAGGGHVTTDKIAHSHPAIFPEKLAHDHIISWSNENDIVLDPFCGSGTTCKMAKKLNRRYIGIEIAKEYCEIAEQRVNNLTTNLFKPAI